MILANNTMVMRSILLLLLVVWTSGFTQDRRIIIQLVDGESKRPVEGAKIISTRDRSVVSNYLGYAEIEVSNKDELVISSIGYETLSIHPSAQGNLRVLMNKRFILISALNLAFDKALEEDSVLNKVNLNTDYGQSASYTGGWTKFYNELAEQLKNDSILLTQKFPIEVRFSVSREGFVKDILTNPESEVIRNGFTMLGKWQPAFQSEVFVDQHFVFLVMRSLHNSPNPAVPMELTAEPKGGMTAFYGHIARNLKYPKEARKGKIEGRVMLKFIVDSDGSIKDIQVLQGIGGGCDEEAVRVVSTSPKWKPGTRRGVPFPQEVRLPIQFRL
ncbi:MAG: TonB family protein [Cyclobacteriaceae bacterium]|nr:TonB family protein [Cyclobacteriaceae bacterium]